MGRCGKSCSPRSGLGRRRLGNRSGSERVLMIDCTQIQQPEFQYRVVDRTTGKLIEKTINLHTLGMRMHRIGDILQKKIPVTLELKAEFPQLDKADAPDVITGLQMLMYCRMTGRQPDPKYRLGDNEGLHRSLREIFELPAGVVEPDVVDTIFFGWIQENAALAEKKSDTPPSPSLPAPTPA